MQKNIPDYKKIDYRGFIFVVHAEYGMLLLHCTRKPKKGPHYQLPGGHVDNFEFEYAAEKCGLSATTEQVLLEACKMGATRELFEETGLDFRGQLERVVPAPLRLKANEALSKSNGVVGLSCMLKHKCYFTLNVTDEDFDLGVERNGASGSLHPQTANGSHLTLKISHEHSGFIFENDPWETIKKIQKHSGGTGSAALRMSMTTNQNPEDVNGKGDVDEDKKHSHSRMQAKKIHVQVYNDDVGFDEGIIDLLPPPRRRRFRDLFSCFQRFC